MGAGEPASWQCPETTTLVGVEESMQQRRNLGINSPRLRRWWENGNDFLKNVKNTVQRLINGIKLYLTYFWKFHVYEEFVQECPKNRKFHRVTAVFLFSSINCVFILEEFFYHRSDELFRSKLRRRTVAADNFAECNKFDELHVESVSENALSNKLKNFVPIRRKIFASSSKNWTRQRRLSKLKNHRNKSFRAAGESNFFQVIDKSNANELKNIPKQKKKKFFHGKFQKASKCEKQNSKIRRPLAHTLSTRRAMLAIYDTVPRQVGGCDVLLVMLIHLQALEFQL